MPRPGRFTPGKETGYPLHKKLGGPHGNPGQMWKISPPPGFDPHTNQPIASCYTDRAILAHFFLILIIAFAMTCDTDIILSFLELGMLLVCNYSPRVYNLTKSWGGRSTWFGRCTTGHRAEQCNNITVMSDGKGYCRSFRTVFEQISCFYKRKVRNSAILSQTSKSKHWKE